MKYIPFVDSDVILAPSYCNNISQLGRFASVCFNVFDFKERNLCITEKSFHHGFRYHKLVTTSIKFYYQYWYIIRNINQRADISNVQVFPIQSFIVIFYQKHTNVVIHLKS